MNLNILNVLDPEIYNVQCMILQCSLMVMDWPPIQTLMQLRIDFRETCMVHYI
jgi:hypothetical protein